MPTVNSIANQIDLTADVSRKIFRTDFESASRSMLITGPIGTAADMVSANFGMPANISSMLNDYAEQKESFNAEFDRRISSLKESADKFKEITRDNENQRAAVRAKAQESEYARRKSAETFADEARERVYENEQARQQQAEQIAEITRERMQHTTRSRRENTEPLVVAARERVEANEQTLTARTEELANATRQRQREIAQTRREETAQIDVVARERMQESSRQVTETLTENRTVERQQTRNAVLTQRETTENFAREYLVAENASRRNLTDAVDNMIETREENANAALSNVRNLVDRFNDAVSYFNENRDMSDRMSALAGNFDEMGKLTESLNNFGIVNEGGRLRLNERRLIEALDKNSAGVAEALGQNGLTGHLERSVELATTQRDNLFPSITDYITNRRNDPTESLYAAQLNRTVALNSVNGSNFLNVFT